jgi:hypothetical protein
LPAAQRKEAADELTKKYPPVQVPSGPYNAGDLNADDKLNNEMPDIIAAALKAVDGSS